MTWWDTLRTDQETRLREYMRSARGARYLRYARDSEPFAAFLLVADTDAARRLGVSIFDLADWAWRDAFDAGMTPVAALREALSADDLYSALTDGG